MNIMKRIITLIIFICIYTISFAQEIVDKWNEETSIYQNYKYNFSWVLNRELTWVRQPLVQKNAVFGAVNPETNAVAYVVVENKNVGSDIWQHYEQEKINTQNAIKNSPMDIKLLAFDKCRFAGKNAVYMETLSFYSNDSRNPMQMFFNTISYLVYDNNLIYSISIMVNKELRDSLSEEGMEIKDMFFNGWLFDAQ